MSELLTLNNSVYTFDRSEHPRQLKLVELTDWLEALVT
jgi:hypothetical protein